MKFGLVISITLSVILIGVASIHRFAGQKSPESELIAMERFDASDWYYEDVLRDFLNPPTTGTATNYEPLTSTDIVGRQLIIDYVGLAASGGASMSDILTLANQSVDNITTFHVFERAKITDIKIVADNKTNAVNYANEFSRIYSDYAWEINLVSDNAESMAVLYENMSAALKNLPVPSLVSNLHLELVNNHTSTAVAMRSLAEMEVDPVKSLAGMTALRENIISEAYALAEIDRILREKYGNI